MKFTPDGVASNSELIGGSGKRVRVTVKDNGIGDCACDQVAYSKNLNRSKHKRGRKVKGRQKVGNSGWRLAGIGFFFFLFCGAPQWTIGGKSEPAEGVAFYFNCPSFRSIGKTRPQSNQEEFG